LKRLFGVLFESVAALHSSLSILGDNFSNVWRKKKSIIYHTLILFIVMCFVQLSYCFFQKELSV
jgi:hypothetical protein